MFKIGKKQFATFLLSLLVLCWACGPTAAAVRIEGQVTGRRWPPCKFNGHAVGRERRRSQAIGANENGI